MSGPERDWYPMRDGGGGVPPYSQMGPIAFGRAKRGAVRRPAGTPRPRPSVTLLLGFLRRRLYAAATVAHGARHGRCKAGGGVAATEIGRDGLARNFRDGLKVTIRAVAQIAGVPEKGVF